MEVGKGNREKGNQRYWKQGKLVKLKSYRCPVFQHGPNFIRYKAWQVYELSIGRYISVGEMQAVRLQIICRWL